MIEPIYHSFFNEMHRRRKEMKLSGTELGNLVGVTRACISAWELKKNRIGLRKAIDIARVLGIDLNNFGDLKDELR